MIRKYNPLHRVFLDTNKLSKVIVDLICMKKWAGKIHGLPATDSWLCFKSFPKCFHFQFCWALWLNATLPAWMHAGQNAFSERTHGATYRTFTKISLTLLYTLRSHFDTVVYVWQCEMQGSGEQIDKRSRKKQVTGRRFIHEMTCLQGYWHQWTTWGVLGSDNHNFADVQTYMHEGWMLRRQEERLFWCGLDTL